MCLGIPGQIIEITDRARKLAMVDVSGVQREANITCIAGDDAAMDASVGEWVLIHVGFAMSIIDADEAAATLKVLTEMGEIQEEIAAIQASGRI